MVSKVDLVSKKVGTKVVAFDGSRKMAVVRFPKSNEAIAEDLMRDLGVTITVTNGGFNNPEKLFQITW